MQVSLRRGLPRQVGGQAWPPEGSTAELDDATPAPPTEEPAHDAADNLVAVPVRRGLPRVPGAQPYPPEVTAYVEAPAAEPEAAVAAESVNARDTPENLVPVPVRRGLPRVPGAQPHPPEVTAYVEAPAAQPAVSGTPEPAAAPEQPATSEIPAAPAAPTKATAGTRRRYSPVQWISGLVALGFIFGFGVLLARMFLSSGTGEAFLARYDGTQPLPDSAPVGLPAWLNWAHFLNMFLMALIIRTGIQVRRERRPEAFWASRSNPRSKISLTLWLHLMLDLAWLTLGAVFYILLFATGQWMRIVPTSWEVIPNAVSTGVQYLAMDWPLENGWVHYNALQELTYFAVVFIASPISVLSGLRMSPWWPKKWTFFPAKTARALHFPTMVFFVGFIVVHVLLVALTGLRRNLNAMFAARGDVDPSVFASDWTGTWLVLAAIAVIGAASWAARPALVAPLARLTGTVSNR